MQRLTLHLHLSITTTFNATSTILSDLKVQSNVKFRKVVSRFTDSIFFSQVPFVKMYVSSEIVITDLH